MKAGIVVLVLSMACTAQAAAQDRASPHATDLTARAAVDAALQGAAIARLAVSERYTKTHAWVHDRAELGFQPPSGVPGRRL